MNKTLSLYLDLIRFAAAFTVFIGHSAGNLTGGFLWQSIHYLSAAVMIFFVLSGYVISYVYDTKEKNLHNFLVSRVARFSSVVFPAILLTLALDSIGIAINRDIYFSGPWPEPQTDLLNYIVSFFFVQNFWNMNLNPGINVPFWSISYEFGFYLIFAAAVFQQGRAKYLTLVALALIVGPDIMIYLTIWLLGVGVYQLHKRVVNLNIPLSLLLALSSAYLLIAFTPSIKKEVGFSLEVLLTKRNYVADFVYAFLFSIHLFAIKYIAEKLVFLERFRKVIVFLAGSSFSLYLFHRPLIQFFAALELGEPTSLLNRIAIILGSFVFVITVGYWFESKKYIVKKLIVRIVAFSK